MYLVLICFVTTNYINCKLICVEQTRVLAHDQVRQLMITILHKVQI